MSVDRRQYVLGYLVPRDGKGGGQDGGRGGTWGESYGSKIHTLVGDVPVYGGDYEEEKEAWGGGQKGGDN